MKTEIIEFKMTRQAGNDWTVRLSDREGWWMLPTHMVSAEINMRNIRQFKGNPAALEDVTPSAIMGIAMCGYPVQTAYYETAKKGNSKMARR